MTGPAGRPCTWRAPPGGTSWTRPGPEVAALLLQYGADPDVPGWSGRTPYQQAVRTGQDQVAELLARRGASTVLSAADEFLADAAGHGPAAPFWFGLDQQAFEAQLAELRRWADTVLCQRYGGYELRDCWPNHIHAVWDLSTLAAAWHHAYGGQRPDLGRALEFYDRWLPGTMRRIDSITRGCLPQCVMRRRW